MTDRDPDPAEDPWLTLAEIAQELRMSPATVRSWVSKGTLQATRAGQRKWLVRRSELDRMLNLEDFADAAPMPASGPQEETRRTTQRFPENIAPPGSLPYEPTGEEPVSRDDWYAVASYEWEVALDVSRMAPPDAGFAGRIRHVAETAARKAGALELFAEDTECSWKPVPDSRHMTLSYELRPGGNRPGPRKLWAGFDQAVERLGLVTEGTSITAVQRALEDLSVVMHEVADAVADLGGPPPWKQTRGSHGKGERTVDHSGSGSECVE